MVILLLVVTLIKAQEEYVLCFARALFLTSRIVAKVQRIVVTVYRIHTPIHRTLSGFIGMEQIYIGMGAL